MRVIALSGYKPFEIGIFNEKHPGIKYIKEAIKRRLISLIEEGLEWVIISGQLGVELWAGEVVIILKKDYPTIKLAVITPFKDQELKWNEFNQLYYNKVLTKADFFKSISNRPYESPMQFKNKNQFILSNCDGLLVVYEDENPGSVKYIVQEGKMRSDDFPILFLSPIEIQMVADEMLSEEYY